MNIRLFATNECLPSENDLEELALRILTEDAVKKISLITGKGGSSFPHELEIFQQSAVKI